MFKNHPVGLAPLFFTEMWERLSFYVIGGLLLLYAVDTEVGGLGMTRSHANEIVGTYLAFVYFTPFLGGLIADRFLGYRRAVLIGGLSMASGLFLLGTPGEATFVSGLVMVCIGNGLFKPNISVMVGNLYQPGDPRRDAGFNIFYMGINIGAFAAFLLGAYVRNELGWSWAFRMAGVGLLLGVGILLTQWNKLAVADRKPETKPGDIPLARILGTILFPAFLVGGVAYALVESKTVVLPPAMTAPLTAFIAGMIPVIVFFVRLGLKAMPEERPGILALMPIFVSGGTFFMVLHLNTTALTTWAEQDTVRHGANLFDLVGGSRSPAQPSYFRNAASDVPRPDERTLAVVDTDLALMFGTSRLDEAGVTRIETAIGTDVRGVLVSGELGGRPRVDDEAIAKRAANVYPNGTVELEKSTDSHGIETVTPKVEDGTTSRAKIAFVRSIDGKDVALTLVDQKTFGEVYAKAGTARLAPTESLMCTNPEVFQAANAMCVILFTPLIVWFFARLRDRGRPISTAMKILIGLILTMASMLVMAAAGVFTEGNTLKVSPWWLIGAYAVVTAGELCLSPMGLSLVTKLSPKRFVGLLMGGWFCATAFGNKGSGFFGAIQGMLSPVTFFLVLAGFVALVALGFGLLLPKLDKTLKQYNAG